MLSHETDRFVGEPIRQILALLSVFNRWNSIRIEKRWRATECTTANIQIESLVLRIKLRRSSAVEVPLAKESRCLSCFFETFGNRDVFERKMIQHLCGTEFRFRWRERSSIGQVICDPKSSRRLAGQDGSSGGRADGCCRAGIRETHPLSRETVYVGSLNKLVSLTRQIHPAQIVDQDEKNIGWGDLSGS